MPPTTDKKVSCMLTCSVALADTLVSGLPAQALKHPMDARHNVASMEVGRGSQQPLKSEPDGHVRKVAEPGLYLEAKTHTGVGQKEGN